MLEIKTLMLSYGFLKRSFDLAIIVHFSLALMFGWLFVELKELRFVFGESRLFAA